MASAGGSAPAVGESVGVEIAEFSFFQDKTTLFINHKQPFHAGALPWGQNNINDPRETHDFPTPL